MFILVDDEFDIFARCQKMVLSSLSVVLSHSRLTHPCPSQSVAPVVIRDCNTRFTFHATIGYVICSCLEPGQRDCLREIRVEYLTF
jgi:hypothetical protein